MAMNFAFPLQAISSLCSLLTGAGREREIRGGTGETIRQDETGKMRRKLDWYGGVEKEIENI